jgi:hypothetical protein
VSRSGEPIQTLTSARKGGMSGSTATGPNSPRSGCPPEVYLDEARWSDFLENGHLHWHASSGFEFGHLSAGQRAALHRFLERELGTARRCPPLLGWVRVRCGVG